MQWNPFASGLRAGNPHFPNKHPLRGGGSMQVSTLQKAQVVALLHDVGDFYLRAGFSHYQSDNLLADISKYASPSKGTETSPLPSRALSDEVGSLRMIDGDLHGWQEFQPADNSLPFQDGVVSLRLDRFIAMRRM